jgi:hypothetical protein
MQWSNSEFERGMIEPQGLGLVPMVIEQSGAASAPTISTPGC